MPIRSEDLAGFDHRSALLLELRRRTYELAPDGGDGWMRTGRIRTTRAAATAKAGSPLPRRPARA